MSCFVSVSIYNVGAIIFFAFSASFMMSMLGVIAGLWAEKFDHMAAVTNFVVTPLSFLSGTFYSIELLPDIFQKIAMLNPLFYMIDGFRYGFINYADAPLWLGVTVLIGVNIFLWWLTARLLDKGYKLKG